MLELSAQRKTRAQEKNKRKRSKESVRSTQAPTATSNFVKIARFWYVNLQTLPDFKAQQRKSEKRRTVGLSIPLVRTHDKHNKDESFTAKKVDIWFHNPAPIHCTAVLWKEIESRINMSSPRSQILRFRQAWKVGSLKYISACPSPYLGIPNRGC